MLRFLDAKDDTLAMEISGTLTGAELDTVMDRVEAAMADHDKLHLFIETHGFAGVELAALPNYTLRAMPLLGKLGHFGRVAVVADQAWIRAGTRMESAMLPKIAYRVFMPEQRDEALAWVRGEGGGEG